MIESYELIFSCTKMILIVAAVLIHRKKRIILFRISYEFIFSSAKICKYTMLPLYKKTCSKQTMYKDKYVLKHKAT